MSKSQIQKTENLAVDLARHFLSLAVIVLHMHSETRYSVETNSVLTSIGGWIDGCVFGFFAFSGYFYHYAEPLIYISKQVKRLLVPYFIFSIFYATVLAFLQKQSFGNGLYATIYMQGAGMQLYFLPILFLVSVAWNFASKYFSWTKVFVILTFFLGVALSFPSSASIGPNPLNIPLYASAYLVGVIFRRFLSVDKFRSNWVVVVALVFLVLGHWDARLIDLAFASFLLAGAVIFGEKLPNSRLCGSGGVYLLHTPLVNFGVSIAFEKIGISQLNNFYFSVVFTYVTCLFLTIIFVRIYPSKRWLLLE